ncbi:unnamed protein product [Rhizophagus irregularis]|nr:unnamed protein product [Rhizophagus irregularis]
MEGIRIIGRIDEIQIAKAVNGFWQDDLDNYDEFIIRSYVFEDVKAVTESEVNVSIHYRKHDLDNYDEFTYEILDITRSYVVEDIKANTESEVSVSSRLTIADVYCR